MDRQLPTRTSGAATTRASGPARNQQQAVDIHLEGGSAPDTHAGKVLAAIQPHCDDIPIFAGGTVSKLVAEGYSGVLIRTTNDEMAGAGRTPGEVILNNERDNYEVARRLGLHKVYDLGYRNHLLDGVSRTEMRARLIFLFRLLKVDTVVSYDPWAHYDENPDHVVTAEVVEAAFRVRTRLVDAGLTTLVMTTGGKGLHVVAPLRRTVEDTKDRRIVCGRQNQAENAESGRAARSPGTGDRDRRALPRARRRPSAGPPPLPAHRSRRRRPGARPHSELGRAEQGDAPPRVRPSADRRRTGEMARIYRVADRPARQNGDNRLQ